MVIEMKKEEINKLFELLKNHKVYVQTHNFPDPDAIGSAYGLQQLLKYHGIESHLCYVGSIERSSLQNMIKMLPIQFATYDEINHMSQNDYVVTVDGQKYNTNLTDLSGYEIACIDHHPTVFDYDYLYKDIRIVGACSTLITQYYIETNTPMNEMVATALLYGLQVDTANLTRGVTTLDIDMFSYLYQKANTQLIYHISKSSMELSDLKAYGAAIESIHLYGKTGFAYIPFDCPDALIAMVADFILALQEINFCVIYSYRQNGLKFSVRSGLPHQLDAGNIVQKALVTLNGNGGGHSTMAGGFLSYRELEKTGITQDHWDGIIEESFLKQLQHSEGEIYND